MAKIFLIAASYGGSVSGFRGQLIRTLIKLGYDVHVSIPEANEEMANEIRLLGCSLHVLPLKRTGLNPAADFLYFIKLLQLMKGLKPTCFLGYTVKPVIYGNLAAFFAKIPVRCALITGLGFAFTSKVGGLKKGIIAAVQFLYKIALSKTTNVLFQNPDDRQLFIDIKLVDAKKCGLVNGSGVDLAHYKVSSLPSEPVFLFIGRLLTDKGIREYVESAKKVKKKYPNARFLVAGWIDSNPTAITQAELDEWISNGTIEFFGEAK